MHLGQHWVKLKAVWDSTESNWKRSGTALSQTERGTKCCRFILSNTVLELYWFRSFRIMQQQQNMSTYFWRPKSRPSFSWRDTFWVCIEIFSLAETRVGHCVLSCSERSVLSRSFKECSVLSRSFFEFLATYETQQNGTFFPLLFKRTGKNVKNVPFFCKEQERTQRLSCSFIKNGKERKNVLFFCKRTRTFFFQYIYRYI